MSILLESALVEQLLTIWYNGDISRTFVLADLSSKTSHIPIVGGVDSFCVLPGPQLLSTVDTGEASATTRNE
jgi:hypothetical protein